MKRWFYGIEKVVFRCKEAVSLLVIAAIRGYGNGFLVLVLVIKHLVFASLTCLLALGGSIVGTLIGAMKGHTTETGFLGGAAIGSVTGAITAMQLLESLVDGDMLSTGALLGSMVSGKVFMEWVSPAVLKAYQWQISTQLGTTYREITDIYDTFDARGLSLSSIQQLPESKFHSSNNMMGPCTIQPCSICLQDFVDGECARRLPKCQHMFHVGCIDEWLRQQGSCPMCRLFVCDHEMDHIGS